MKKSITVLVLLAVGLMHAQAFKGKGDVKFDVGANFQEGGSGIRVSADLRKHVIWVCYSYLLSVSNDDLGNKPEFDDRIDAKVRFNANLGNVFQLDENGYLSWIEFGS
jgi:hypothetical protein